MKPKLASYFPWANAKQDDLYDLDEDVVFPEAVKRQDVINLQRVFNDRPKYRNSIAFHLAKSANDEMILCFIKQTPSSISLILNEVASYERLALTKLIFDQYNGWVSTCNADNFITQIIEDTQFLITILARGLVKPSIILLHQKLNPEQFRILLESLTVNQLVSLMADCCSDDDLVKETLKALKTKGALQAIFTFTLDLQSNTFLHLASPLLINKVLKMVPLPKSPILNSMGLNPLEYNIFIGNFPMAAFLKKFNFTFSGKSKAQFITAAIIYALECTEDKFKYNALVHLLKQADITFPPELHYLHAFINNPKSCQIRDSVKLEPYICKLSEFYIHCFSDPSADTITQIQQAMNAINRDFSLEILSHAGYLPEPLLENKIVFRGSVGPLDEDFIKSFLELGYHSSFAFKNGNHFNRNAFLNYDTKSTCVNDDLIRYEFCGNYTYLSQNPAHSLEVYARSNLTKYRKNIAFLIEARLEAGAPKVVGANTHEFEFIADFIEPRNIRAVYIVNEYNNITKSFVNPNYFACNKEGELFVVQRKVNLNFQHEKKVNQAYYDEFSKYIRPSRFNRVNLKFDKKKLHGFLVYSHDNVKKFALRYTRESEKIEIESQSYLGKDSSTYSEYGFFANWKRNYKQKYPEKCAYGYGPGALIAIPSKG